MGLWAAGVALFVLGGATGAGLLAGLEAPQRALQAGSGEWLQRAAVAHAVYVPEKRHPVEVSVEQNQDGHLARWLTKRLDVPVKLFDLAPQGFDLVGGRLLPDERGPSAQLMYQNAAGSASPSTCESPTPARSDPAAAAFRYERQGELGLFYWVEGQGAAATGYALVGSLPREQLLALAEAIYRQGGAAGESRAALSLRDLYPARVWRHDSRPQCWFSDEVRETVFHGACRVRRALACEGLMSDSTSASASRATAMSQSGLKAEPELGAGAEVAGQPHGRSVRAQVARSSTLSCEKATPGSPGFARW